MSRDRMKLVGTVLVACLVAVPVAATAKEFAQLSSQGQGVTLRARPVDIAANGKSWTLEIAVDTHSQDLADDFTRTAVLIDAKGKPHAPLAWDGAAPGGHHRQGVLRFEPISPAPAVLELRIQRAGETAPRSFKWPLQ